MSVLRLVKPSGPPRLRVYLRRSRADAGHQQFSLETQREGARRFATEELARRGLALRWDERVEYLDDDRAGDDFLGRPALGRLVDEARPGDVIVCRDQSRIGRDALEVTLVVRKLVQERGARLHYYAGGEEVRFQTAVDQAITFIQGTGHQIEVEAIRSRTREALRERVRAGRAAGGRCYGYDPVRRRDASGRAFTEFVVNEPQAEVVRRVYREFLDGKGLKRVAAALNADAVPSPRAGRRGTGSWAPSALYAMLRNERYRGVYLHGRIQRVRRGGRRVAVAASADEILRVEVPEWRIIDEPTWLAVQEQLVERARDVKSPGPACKYPLSGIGRCAVCGGAIGVVWSKEGKAYGCTWRHNRGPAVCSASVRQPREEVETALADHLRGSVLPSLLHQVVEEVRREVDRRLAQGADTEAIEHELARLRAEQKNVAGAIATAGPIPELLAAMQERNDHVRQLEASLAVAQRTPEMLAEILRHVEATVGGKLDDLGAGLGADGSTARAAYHALFPEGLRFSPTEAAGRPGWKITGNAAFKLDGDPNGIPLDLTVRVPLSLVVPSAAA